MIPYPVAIRYRRLPDRLDIFRQTVIERSPECVVTFHEAAPVREPSIVDDRIILEKGSPVIWFTYPGAWYDVGRFHRADGTFTGTYANILTPVSMLEDGWSTTDLCLDVWRGADGSVHILDEDDFEVAIRNGWMDEFTARRARSTAEALAEAARAGTWPPPEVEAWTLERARAVATPSSS